MACSPRFDLPGVPQHIAQRGNNRLPCFPDDGDRLRYLALLCEVVQTTHVCLHAYVLMDNHVHLLSTLWAGRYKACLLDSDDDVLACYRYIELNPPRLDDR